MREPMPRGHERGFIKELADALRDRLPRMSGKIVEVHKLGRLYEVQVRRKEDFGYLYGLAVDSELCEEIAFKKTMKETYDKDV